VPSSSDGNLYRPTEPHAVRGGWEKRRGSPWKPLLGLIAMVLVVWAAT
jgi:hypothetical protein